MVARISLNGRDQVCTYFEDSAIRREGADGARDAGAWAGRC